jgi:S-adenosylmethionine:tRNA ribosyltransferase-isomerase
VLTRDFDYELPAEAIAQEPAPRGESRLLVLDREGDERHRRVGELPALLRRGDLLVVNDTRVLPARLYGHPRRNAGDLPGTAAEIPSGGRASEPPGGNTGGPADDRASGATGDRGIEAAGGGAVSGPLRDGGAVPRVELLLVERLGEREWEVLVRPGRRARPGAVIELDAARGLSAEVLALAGDGRRRVRFSLPIEAHLDRLGHIPLPPYIRRPDDTEDRERYQTVYARSPGAIAAPTAGLHFSAGMLAALEAAGIERVAVTLHVGIGTFKPVTAALVSEHRMDRERYEVSTETAAAIAAARAAGRRVVAVGTTVVRALESAVLANPTGDVQAGAGTTELFITPGFRFQVVDVLLTNFHLPHSTLLMMVSAFAGRDRTLAAYREALALGYRFFSYGDAMLAERRPAE